MFLTVSRRLRHTPKAGVGRVPLDQMEVRTRQWQRTKKQFVDTLTRLGVEVAAEKHGNHSDNRYRSPVWRDVHVADHALLNS